MKESMNRSIRTLARSSSVLRHAWPGLLLALGLVLLPGAASAADVVQCLGTKTVGYSPGLTLTPRATLVTVTNDFTTCTGASDPAVASAFGEHSNMDTANCTDVLGGAPGIQHSVLLWNTGDTSTFSYTVSAQRIGAVVVVTQTGEITAGLFEGATAVAVGSLVSSNVLGCLAPGGVTEYSGPALLTITLAE